MINNKSLENKLNKIDEPSIQEQQSKPKLSKKENPIIDYKSFVSLLSFFKLSKKTSLQIIKLTGDISISLFNCLALGLSLKLILSGNYKTWSLVDIIIIGYVINFIFTYVKKFKIQ